MTKAGEIGFACREEGGASPSVGHFQGAGGDGLDMESRFKVGHLVLDKLIRGP